MLMDVAQDRPRDTGGRDAASEPPVDLKHLARYTMGDKALEKEILELFLAQLPQTIAALDKAETDRDWRIAAHTLKGSGRAVGAWQVARLAEVAEREVARANPEHCADIIARIERAAAEAGDFIRITYKTGA